MSKKMSIEISHDKNYDVFDDYTLTVVRDSNDDYSREIFFYANKNDSENIFIVDSVFDFRARTLHDLIMFNIDVDADVVKNAEQIMPFIDMYAESHATNILYFKKNADKIAMALGFMDDIEIQVEDSYIVEFKINPSVNFDR